jgi:hypothetical protein
LVLAHGSASIAFGLLTVGAAAIPLRTALFVTAAWLVAYAGAAGIGAHMAMPVSMARRAATAWALLDVALALLVLAYPATTIFSLLFFGAVYAAMFGAWQLAVGRWLRSGVRHGFARPRNPHANSSPARLHGSSLRQ